MDKGLGLLSSKMDARLKAEPDLRLLLELEPAYRVFLRNLADTVFSRATPPTPASKLAPFWRDVFVPTGLPWGSFMESMLLHLAILSVVWSVGQSWIRQEQIQQRKYERQSFITYYAPSYPAIGSSPPRERTPPKQRQEKAIHRSPTRVARERPKPAIKPPDVKLAHSDRSPNLASNPASARMPLFAPKLSHFTVPEGPESAVGPAPDVSQGTARRFGLSASSAVPPSPGSGSLSSGRTVIAPSPAVVAPAPSLQSSLGNIEIDRNANIGQPKVIAPLPQLSVGEQRNNSRALLANLGPGASVVPPPQSIKGPGNANGRVSSRLVALVVPPAPSVAGAAGRAGAGAAPSLSLGSQIVRPPESIEGSSNVNGRVSSGLLALVVPPSPSISGTGRASGKSSGGRMSELSGSGSRVVPPSPSVQGVGRSSAAGRRDSLSGAGPEVVPPPQSIRGSDGKAGGRAVAGFEGDSQAVPPAPKLSGTGRSSAGQVSSLFGSGTEVAPPPPSSGDSANSAGRETTANAVVPPAPPAEKASVPATIELPVRVIGLAIALPSTSYFSNYEVFIAERRLKRGGSELIKLVSVSLPYQPRLSEYGVDNSRVYKLQVTRDPSCDETLMQMTWPQADETNSRSQFATATPAPPADDRNSRLPCYRTTADDYWRALSQGR